MPDQNRVVRLAERLRSRNQAKAEASGRKSRAFANARGIVVETPGLSDTAVYALLDAHRALVRRGEIYRHWPEAEGASRVRRGAEQIGRDAGWAMTLVCLDRFWTGLGGEFIGLDDIYGAAIAAAGETALAVALDDLLSDAVFLEMTAPWREAVGPIVRQTRLYV